LTLTSIYIYIIQLALLVTPLPLIFKKKRFTEFKDREDLIKCNMASVHLVSLYQPNVLFCRPMQC